MRVYVYGIPNCDQIKKTLAWLKTTPHEVHFHNYKTFGVPPERLDKWFSHVPWESLLNKRGTTWRSLGPDAQSAVTDQLAARALLIANPSLIRRPVIEIGDHLLIGFDQALLEQRLADA